MTSDIVLAELAAFCGILPGYHDMGGQHRVTGPQTQRALLAGLGLDVGNDAQIAETLAMVKAEAEARWFPQEIVVNSGEVTHLEFGLGVEWALMAGEAVVAQGRAADAITLPALAPEIYSLQTRTADHAETIRVLAAPARLPAIEERTDAARQWGLSLALYGLRSPRNSGQGDFVDLARAAKAAGQHGAAFLGINPVHNMGYADAVAYSPYSPSHRGFLNTSCIAPDAIPGLQDSIAAAGVLAKTSVQIAALHGSDAIGYEAHKPVHKALLEDLYRVFQVDAGISAKDSFKRFIQTGGAELARFARFESLSEIHGANWSDWPDTIAQTPDRIDYHCWLQWVADTQLGQARTCAREAGMSLGLYLDLAVGARLGGGEAWCEQACLARGVSIGAPPDHLSPEGQNWALAAFSPRKLAAVDYAPLRRILARTMRHAGLIRIDHVLGLNRSFWLPDDGSPGGYIRQPFEALSAVIRIEAARHGTCVIGEDLGLVPDGFRETMRGRGYYGYSVLQYEKDDAGQFRDPATCPAQVLSCFGTHDTPTAAGYAEGRDIGWWHKLGWINDGQADAARDARSEEVAALRGFGPDDAAFPTSVHRTLARSNAALVCAQLDDVLGEPEAQNLPGTIAQHPNWRRRYHVSVEALNSDAGLATLGADMEQAGRKSAPLKEMTND